ncbi:ditrans,polycis-polyprenyl diphosphate synthase [Cymbomonas tetramitiformis]|uniref:protein acetyllysine N-acetyltransferase n=1 Tax=Cymbomonas tetramitiformis TaxID=36881 RepID=A0AAE0BCP4_9CHLO|nr:ditrans,polycis-polyprenyl diphosphate synthase [Cymbomonas tetramitiformis]
MLGGQLGAREFFDPENEVRTRARQLAILIQETQSKGGVVVHTGAGISTSAGIPDFRGPNGVWTCQSRGDDLPKASLPFDQARPSFTHMAILALHQAGLVRFVVSCNVDCLHIRSGLPREALAELHGNCFAERLSACSGMPFALCRAAPQI